MNIIQATPSINESWRITSFKSIDRPEQKERILQPSPSVIVTLGKSVSDPLIYNKDGFIGSVDSVDDGMNASDKVTKQVIQDQNARMAASISANSPYAYAVAQLYVNTGTASETVAKMLPKAIAGIQPVSPISTYGTTLQLAH